MTAVTFAEQPVSIPVGQHELFGIIHLATTNQQFVIFVAGQPQTRHGPHRLFVDLARQLQQEGVSSLRFDCQGWGDSTGEARPYQSSIDDVVAVHRYLAAQFKPEQIILLGLCDGASAAILASQQLPNSPLLLLNPFIDNAVAQSKALLAHHYGSQFKQPSKLIKHLLAPQKIASKLRNYLSHRKTSQKTESKHPIVSQLELIKSAILVILSANDLTAQQTKIQLQHWLYTAQSDANVVELPNADHTFSLPGNKAALWNKIQRFITQTNCHTIK